MSLPEDPSVQDEEADRPTAAPPEPSPKVAEVARLDAREIERWLPVLDVAARPTSQLAWGVRLLVAVIAVMALWQKTRAATRPMLAAKPPPAISTEAVGEDRFKIPERTRRQIFADLAAAELAERARAISANTWNGHAWSREDDRGWYERVAARTAAVKYHVSLSQVYLVLDEGLRNHWPGPDGNPLPATTPPLEIRSNSW